MSFTVSILQHNTRYFSSLPLDSFLLWIPPPELSLLCNLQDVLLKGIFQSATRWDPVTNPTTRVILRHSPRLLRGPSVSSCDRWGLGWSRGVRWAGAGCSWCPYWRRGWPGPWVSGQLGTHRPRVWWWGWKKQTHYTSVAPFTNMV